MTEATLTRARAGDEDAFRELTDPYRRELQLHCYRILGSVLLEALPDLAPGPDVREVVRRRDGRRVQLVPARANGQPAFGYYLPDPHAPIRRAYGLLVLELAGDRISGITRFGDTGLFARFGLPRVLPE